MKNEKQNNDQRLPENKEENKRGIGEPQRDKSRDPKDQRKYNREDAGGGLGESNINTGKRDRQ